MAMGYLLDQPLLECYLTQEQAKAICPGPATWLILLVLLLAVAIIFFTLTLSWISLNKGILHQSK